MKAREHPNDAPVANRTLCRIAGRIRPPGLQRRAQRRRVQCINIGDSPIRAPIRHRPGQPHRIADPPDRPAPPAPDRQRKSSRTDPAPARASHRAPQNCTTCWVAIPPAVMENPAPPDRQREREPRNRDIRERRTPARTARKAARYRYIASLFPAAASRWPRPSRRSRPTTPSSSNP